MIALAWLATAFAVVLLALHVTSAAIVAARVRLPTRFRSSEGEAARAGRVREGVSIIRPVRGIDAAELTALATSFHLEPGPVEVLFCVADADDPIVPVLEASIASHAVVDARLLIGDVQGGANPKLDNIAKGWRAARYPWVAIVDSNVRLAPDHAARLLAAWRDDTGLVSAPGLAASPATFAAEVEAAYLDTYQARWLYAGDAMGNGFAQGKNLLFRKADLERWGGIEALAGEIAEDAAATKLVRRAGRRVHLADPPVFQELGIRDFRTVLRRQVRWAKLRRLAFPGLYAGELLTTGMAPVMAAAFAGEVLMDAGARAGSGVLALWLAVEAALAKLARWHMSWRSPLAWIIRDLTLPFVWLAGWRRSGYAWRGNTINIAATARDTAR